MFASNPFADLATIIPLNVIQGYVILMATLVVGGTVIDMIHKKSAKYFFRAAEKAKKNQVKAAEDSKNESSNQGHQRR